MLEAVLGTGGLKCAREPSGEEMPPRYPRVKGESGLKVPRSEKREWNRVEASAPLMA